jgi:hypothetical protein
MSKVVSYQGFNKEVLVNNLEKVTDSVCIKSIQLLRQILHANDKRFNGAMIEEVNDNIKRKLEFDSKTILISKYYPTRYMNNQKKT